MLIKKQIIITILLLLFVYYVVVVVMIGIMLVFVTVYYLERGKIQLMKDGCVDTTDYNVPHYDDVH